MTVDISKIKVGDTVTAQHVVQEVYSDGSGLRTTGSYNIFADKILSHTPKPIELEAGVKFKGHDGEVRTILCKYENWCMAARDSGRGVKPLVYENQMIRDRLAEYGPQ